MSSIALDDTGFPVRIDTINPRVFALHKVWVSRHDDRESVKKQQDMEQASVVAELAVNYLGQSFDNDDLSALPVELRKYASDLIPAPQEVDLKPTEPDWW
jgi:hypothetical protein